MLKKKKRIKNLYLFIFSKLVQYIIYLLLHCFFVYTLFDFEEANLFIGARVRVEFDVLRIRFKIVWYVDGTDRIMSLLLFTHTMTL